MSNIETQKRLDDVLANLSEEKASDVLVETKADEAMNTTNTSVLVEETVGALVNEESELANVSAMFGNIINMPTSTYKVPMAGEKPKFFKGSENGDVPGTAGETSKQAFDKLVLTAEKLTAGIYVSEELVKNTKFDLLSFVRTNTRTAFNETLDNILLNGDTTETATGNVNSDDAAPVGNEDFLVADGLRKAAIDEGTDIDAGVLDLADFRAMRRKLGKKGLKVSKLNYLTAYETYFDILSLSPVETVEKFGSAATVTNGVLTSIDGVKLTPVDIEKTDEDGKINVVPGAAGTDLNTKGQIILVHTDGIFRGSFGELKFYTDFIAKTQQYEIIAVAYFAQKIKAGHVAMLRNITLS